MTSILDSIKIEHEKLDKYNIIVKGELTQTKQWLEKLYTSFEKIDEHIFHQKPSYEKIGLGYLLREVKKER